MRNDPTPPSDSVDVESETTRAIYRRVLWRLVPLLFIGYVTAYLNRVNVGFAKLQMLADLKFSDTIYGLGAGIFFVGYFVFEVPSNIALSRYGARVWIARITITWSLISAATLLVSTPLQFYTLRFLLGAAEAGFFPGVIFYLGTWFPPRLRAQITAYFVSAIGLSGVVGGPLSGWIMEQFAGVRGYAGWQWLFLLEAIPSLVVGLLVLRWLPNGINDARWLNDEEKRVLHGALTRANSSRAAVSLRTALLHPRVWLLGTIYFTLMIGLYGISFWLPQIIRNTIIKTTLGVGFVSAIPYAVAVVVMIGLSRYSDRIGARFGPMLITLLMAIAGFGCIGLWGDHKALVMLGLILATTGVLSTMPLFWTIPAGFLSGAAAAAGIAMINSLGNLGGFAGPYMVGALNDLTHQARAGLYLIAGFLVAGTLLFAWALRPSRALNVST